MFTFVLSRNSQSTKPLAMKQLGIHTIKYETVNQTSNYKTIWQPND